MDGWMDDELRDENARTMKDTSAVYCIPRQSNQLNHLCFVCISRILVYRCETNETKRHLKLFES